jgi:hypothetical protein
MKEDGSEKWSNIWLTSITVPFSRLHAKNRASFDRPKFLLQIFVAFLSTKFGLEDNIF